MTYQCNHCFSIYEGKIFFGDDVWEKCPWCGNDAAFIELINLSKVYKYRSVQEPKKMDIDKTLEERGKRYGEFFEHAAISQRIKKSMSMSEGWDRLDSFHQEALEMIAHKIGRIINGDPNYHDSWHDIVGYAKLAADEILKRQENATAKLYPHLHEALSQV